jgi:hypothetical protein
VQPQPSPQPQADPSLLAEVAAAEIKVQRLIVDLPAYARRFRQLLRAPLRSLRRLDHGPDAARIGVAFMLQGIGLSFLLFTAAWALPQSLVTSFSTAPLFAARTAPAADAARLQAFRAALPAGVAKDWTKRGELVLLVRTLPEPQFVRLLERVRALGQTNPELLEHAVRGTLLAGSSGLSASNPGWGGRGYVLDFFAALDPRAGALLQGTRDLAGAGTRYELKPHVQFLARNVLLWSLVSVATAALLPRTPDGGRRRGVLIAGAYLVGILSPLFQAGLTAQSVYLAATLPAYVRLAGDAFLAAPPDAGALEGSLPAPGAAATALLTLGGGVFPGEHLLFVLFRVTLVLLTAAWATAGLAAGVRGIPALAGRVSAPRAWGAAGAGLLAGLGLSELALGVLVQILAPTGLL